jgi:ribonuclease G
LLKLFRRKLRQGKAPSETAPPPAPPAVTPPPAEAGAQPTKRRRRGSRGGRNRRKPAGARADATKAEPSAAADKKADKPERKPAAKPRARQQQQRRRTPPRRPPLPKAKRELLVSVDVGEQRVAVLEDDRPAEVYLERPERRSIAGNIYKGTVDNVLPGMEAAFVEIGLEKNGFLYVDEIVTPELEGRGKGRKIQDLLKRGQEVMVQAVKDPMKSKGARLTTEISLPGRFVVYVPSGEGLGVSRRLEDDERARLRDIVKAIAPKQGGVIVRTAAEGASAEDVERDLAFLQKLWKSIEAHANSAKAPALVYQEAELPLRVTRDLFTDDFEKALVDDDRTYKRIVGYLKKTSPHMVDRVIRHREKTPLFEQLGVEEAIRSTLSRRVDLPSGGYLVFDYAEAFTVIDVNTGRFVGSRSKSSGARLEDTITANNLEAVKEVVHQLRLRDIGGIIVIDFIDMANPKNRATVEEALKTELERDRTKTYVVEISPLGLVEMTRQNVTEGPREILTQKCPTCGGDGIVLSTHSAAVDAERRLRTLAAGAKRGVEAFRVELEEHVAAHLIGPGASRLAEIERLAKRRFFLEGKAGVPLDHFEVKAEGKLADIAPETPIEEGAEVRLELVEVGLHDVGAGMGKLDGLSVCVADAAKLIGKKVKIRVERVVDGTAYATLVQPVRGTAEGPITAEAEAEKPTRAPRKKKAEEAPAKKEEAPAEKAESAAEVEKAPAETSPADEPEKPAAKRPVRASGPGEGVRGNREAPLTSEDGEGVTQGEKPKKRTRRGSRGGRGRKRKPAAATAAGNGQAEPKPEPQKTPAVATIHVPSPDLGQDGEAAADGEQPPKKKRTRRGSRGGRNRRKKPASASAEAKPESSGG